MKGGMLIALAILAYGALRFSTVGQSPDATSRITASEKKIAPDFELKTLDGRTLKLSDFRGKAIILNLWATYCGPCRVEMPWLNELYKQYHSRGLEVVGVSMDDDGEQQQVADFVRELGVSYTILLGNHTVGDAYGGGRLLPQTFFIDRDGHTVASATGMTTKSEFERAIKDLFVGAR
jgi:peroxiredoxin